jgi:hypothetical protein
MSAFGQELPSGCTIFFDDFEFMGAERLGAPWNSRSVRAVRREEGRMVRLVVASTLDTEHVQSGRDASKIKKDFDPKEDLVGEVAELNGDRY